MRVSLFVIALVTLVAEAQAVTIAWSPIGNPGNAPDPLTGHGAVASSYSIGTYDVTLGQYVEFLNAKDPTGANALGLYDLNMSGFPTGGIRRLLGNPDGSKYVPFPGFANHPMTTASWPQAARFANWLNNGQGNADTESGAYTLVGGGEIPTNANSATRNADAKIFLPSENEWYKAAFYDPSTGT